jgi:nitrous oxidase accessory protein NosD
MASTRSVVKSLLSTGMAVLLWATGVAAAPPAAALAVIVVGTQSASCPNPQHATIQAAVDAASAGDTIRVCAGTYNEAVTVDKPLVFRGAQAGVDARFGRTNPARESVVQPPAGSTGFTVTGGVSDVSIDGFTVRDATADGISTLSGGSGFTIVNNIVTGNRIGINFRSPGTSSSRSVIRSNRLVDNNNSLPQGGGSGIFLGGGQSTDFTSITQNRFGGHVNADVNTQGVANGSDPGEALSITGNTSVDSATFLVLINATSPRVTTNQITKNSALPSGSAMLIDTNTDGARIEGNTITGGAGTGINVTAQFGSLIPSARLTVTTNRITSRTNGLSVSALDSGTFSGNVIQSSSNNGIQVNASVTPTTPLRFIGNVSTGNSVWDATDDTTGGGTAGTANTWTGNVCPKDDPNGICV